MNTKKSTPKTRMGFEQRDAMYHQEVGEWLKSHPTATASEIDQMHRKLARKWKV